MWIRSAFSASRLRTAILVAIVVGAVALFVTQPRPAGPRLAATDSPDPLSVTEIHTVLLPDAIRAIDHPDFVTAEKAGMRDNLNVIGIELGGEAHAYPIPFMSQVEIVNDRLGGTNIAVTW